MKDFDVYLENYHKENHSRYNKYFKNYLKENKSTFDGIMKKYYLAYVLKN